MQPESPKLLEDIRVAAEYVLNKTQGSSLDAYLADDVLRPAVERHFEIIGEALNRLARRDPSTVARITDHAQIIAFRNVLIHGYDAIDHRRVWESFARVARRGRWPASRGRMTITFVAREGHSNAASFTLGGIQTVTHPLVQSREGVVEGGVL